MAYKRSLVWVISAAALLVLPLLARRATATPRAQSNPQNQVYEAGKDGVSYPRCEKCPDPEYSAQALRLRWQGTVWLEAVIMPDGSDIKLVKGPSASGLNVEGNAIEAVKRWKFRPATKSGTPVAVKVPIAVAFKRSVWPD